MGSGGVGMRATIIAEGAGLLKSKKCEQKGGEVQILVNLGERNN